MGVELARAFVTIRGDSSGLGGDLQDVRDKVDQAAKDMAAGVAGLLAPLAMFGKRLLTDSLDTAGFFEKTTAQMTVFTKSTAETQKRIKELIEFGVQTPFQIPELFTATEGLMSVGIEGDRIIPTLKALGDAAMGDRDKFGRLMYVFKEAQSKGRILGNDFMQLTSTGALSVKLLAETMGWSVQKAQSRIRDLTSTELMTYFTKLTSEGGHFENMMQTTAKTMVGMKSNFQDSIIYIKKFLGEPLVPYMKAFYAAATQATISLGAMLQKGGEASAFAVVGATAFASIGAALYGASFAARLFGTSLKQVIISGLRIGGPIVLIGALVGWLISATGIIGKIQAGIAGVRKMFTLNNETAEKFRMAWDNIKLAATIAFDAIRAAVQPFLDYVSTFFGWVGGKATSVFSSMATSVSEFALDMSEWIVVIADNWKQIWDNFPGLVQVAFSAAVDIVKNAFKIILYESNKMLGKAPENMVSGWSVFLGELKIAGEQVLDLAEGVATGKVVHTMDETVMRIRQEAQKAGDAAKAWINAAPPDLGTLSPETMKLKTALGLDGLLNDLEQQKKDKEAGRSVKPIKVELGTPVDSLDKKSLEDAGIGGPMSKAGIFQIEELGKNMQKNMLDDKKNPAHQTNALLEDGKKLQEKHLKVAEQMAAKIGGGMEE